MRGGAITTLGGCAKLPMVGGGTLCGPTIPELSFASSVVGLPGSIPDVDESHWPLREFQWPFSALGGFAPGRGGGVWRPGRFGVIGSFRFSKGGGGGGAGRCVCVGRVVVCRL